MSTRLGEYRQLFRRSLFYCLPWYADIYMEDMRAGVAAFSSERRGRLLCLPGSWEFGEETTAGCRIEARHDRATRTCGSPPRNNGGRAARVHPTSSK